MRRSITLHRYALFVASAIVCLIFIGGQVKSKNAGLSVPDWPNTYGHFMFAFPLSKMVGGIFWEHLHRMVASVVGIATFVLTWWVYRVDKRSWVKALGVVASAAVIIQGILGGLTVLLMLPAWTSASHGTLAQIYFCSVVTIALVTSPKWQDNPVRRADRPGTPLRSVALATTLVIFAQLIIGAIMRHSEAGLAIPDFPTMFGSWVPPLSDARLAAANRELWENGLLWKNGVQEVTRWMMISNLLHRLGALTVASMVVWTVVKVFREQPRDAELRRPARLLLYLVAVQITLGILTILTRKQFEITSAHVVTGALTLATSLVLTIRARRTLVAVSGTEPRMAPVTDEVIA